MNQSTDFGNFLIRKGFIPFSYKFINGKFEYKDPVQLSTITNGGLDTRYIKDGLEITIGFQEKGLPPTILWPRLNIKRNGPYVHGFQHETIRILDKYKNEDILKGLIDKTIIFELDGEISKL